MSPGGLDTLIRAGKLKIVGDVKYAADMDPYTGPSTLVDIVIRENGIYSVLDSKRGRVFTYDNYGNLLYVFGGPGGHQGMFNRPSAIDCLSRQVVCRRQRQEYDYRVSSYGLHAVYPRGHPLLRTRTV